MRASKHAAEAEERPRRAPRSGIPYPPSEISMPKLTAHPSYMLHEPLPTETRKTQENAQARRGGTSLLDESEGDEGSMRYPTSQNTNTMKSQEISSHYPLPPFPRLSSFLLPLPAQRCKCQSKQASERARRWTQATEKNKTNHMTPCTSPKTPKNPEGVRGEKAHPHVVRDSRERYAKRTQVQL